MSDAAVDVALRMRLQDSATPALDRAAQRAVESERKVAAASEQAAARQRTSYERASYARELLGVRSEQRIQREIQATEAAYDRLMKTGKLSADEQSRALEATRRKVQQLTNEMGRLTKAQEQAANGAKLLRYGGMAVAGGAAGFYALSGPVNRAMSFDERLAHMANTAYSERDATGRRIGMRELETAVNNSVGVGGGTRESAAETLDALIASGAMPVSDALKVLPTITKSATAANADPTQLAQIGIRAMQTFKIKPEDMPNVLNMALAAGQAGGFELKDMAKWLPQQMAAATMSGMSGRAGFAKLAALNQAAAITAGTKDEAGNNVVNLLAKINSQDTANDAKKLGINLPAYLQAQRAKGLDSVDAFAGLVDRTVQGRDDYKALQRRLSAAKGDDEKRATLESMATIAQGAGIGKLIQDRQALMALLGMMNNREYLAQVLATVRANDRAEGGAVDQNFEVIAGTNAYRERQRQQAMAMAEKSAVDEIPGIGAINDAMTGAAQAFPRLTGGLTLAAGGLTAVAGAAGLAALALGSGGGTGAINRAAGRAVPYVMSGGRLLLRSGPWALGGMVAGSFVENVAGKDSDAGRYGSSAFEGAGIGAGIGSAVLPGPGTAIGAAAGALGGALYEWLKTTPKPEQPKMQADVKVSVSDDRVSVSQQRMNVTGMDATFFTQTGTGNIFTGAPL